MKKILAIAALFVTVGAFAQVQEAAMYREGDQMKVTSRINLTPEMLDGAKAFILTPQITDGENVVKLSPIGMYSKDKFYPYLQDYGFTGAPGEVVYTKAQLPTVVNLAKEVPYQVWMDGSRLELVHEYVGCCGDSGFEALDTLAAYEEAPINFTPAFREVSKDKMTKVVTKKGVAKVTFPVNNSKLKENYQNNAAELEKIAASIEEIKNATGDVTIKSVVIKGQSSPEGKFATNERLSRERTKAVVDYISEQYDFGADVLESESVGENWEGLREFVEGSNLQNKAAMLEIIDSDMDPDVKEQKLRSFSKDWRVLHRECLNNLRCTSYEINYETIDYENVNTHIALANDAMQAGEYRNAANHLAFAGDSADAEFARGNLAAILGNYEEATAHFQKALDGGIKEAAPLLEEVSRYKYMK